MAPRTRSAGAPPAGHRQLNNELPKTPLKRSRDGEEDGSESERDSKRPHTEPRGLPIFQRNQSFVGRNRARWQQQAQTARTQRFATPVQDVPQLRPLAKGNSEIIVRQSIEQETSTQSPSKQSTLGWLMSIPGRLFSPAPARASETPQSQQEPSKSPTPSDRRTPELPLQIPSPEAVTQIPLPSEPEQVSPSLTADYKRMRVARGSHKVSRPRREEPELTTEQVEGSNKRKIMGNKFELTYSDDEGDDDNNAQEKPDAYAPQADTVKTQPLFKTPLKSSLRNGPGSATRKQLRIDDTPTVKKVYGYYGPAGEYRGSTFADKTNNSFSTVDSSIHSTRTDESSIAADADTVRGSALTAEARDNTFLNMRNNAKDRTRAMFNTFSSPAKPFVQPNHFEVPDDDSDDDEDSIVLGDGNSATSAPAAPRMSHAELPDASQSLEHGETAQETKARKESEEAALKKLREQAQKYKPKTSSRLSSVQEKSRSRSSSPPASITAEEIIDRDTRQAGEEQQPAGEGPFPAPYTWTKPPRPSYSVDDPHYEPWVFDDVHIGSDGMTDKQRRAAKDAAADAWIADNIKWPEPQTYVDAGLCSPYIDELLRTEVCEEGMKKAEDFYDKQFDDILKWAHEEKMQGNTCALTWNNGRHELVW